MPQIEFHSQCAILKGGREMSAHLWRVQPLNLLLARRGPFLWVVDAWGCGTCCAAARGLLSPIVSPGNIVDVFI